MHLALKGAGNNIPALQYRDKGMLVYSTKGVVVSRVSRDSRDSRDSGYNQDCSERKNARKRQFRLRAGGVSRALWPLNVQRSIATGKVSQGRRLMIMRGIWGIGRIGDFSKFSKLKKIQHQNAIKNSISSLKSIASFSSSLRIYLLCTTIAISFLIAGMFLAAFVLHPWSMMLLLVVTWIVTTAVTTRLWFSCVRSVQQNSALYRLHEHKRRRVRQAHSVPKTIPARRSNPVKDAEDVTVKSYFPMTPMPSTPLVRVLETIDLSSTDVEHFIHGGSQAEEQMPQMPQSQMAFPIDELMSHVDAHMNE